MKTKQLLYSLLLGLIILGSSIGVFAADESYIQTKSGKLKPHDSCAVVDDKFAHLPLAEWNQLRNLSVDNIISFEIRQDTLFFINKPFTCTLNVTIQYFTSRDQVNPTEISNVNLVVKYDTATGQVTYPAATHVFKNAFKVLVIVNSISSPELGTDLPTIFRIKNQILVKRQYPFSQQVNAALSVGQQGAVAGSSTMMMRVSTQPSATPGQLVIDWTVADFPGAEEFDVEWIYVDLKSARGSEIVNNYGGQSGPFTIPDAKVEEWMRYDNSRVTVKLPVYNVNLAYTDGFIIARVRGVSYASGVRLTTNWQYQDNSSHTACTAISAHEPDLNWQFTANFAEEGKRKDVISYFDGELKNRETVTINNADNKAVVAEQVYDNMGRPGAAILPAPVNNSQLKFYPGLNRNSSGQSYSANDLGSSNCIVAASPLSNSVGDGAGQYYSANNAFLGLTNYYFNKYIPDAQGYPLSTTQYTPDNTGRVRAQGGTGQDFQIGGGHETRYFYGKPLQSELDRLFGVEVGNSSHYLKTMVIDPNHQISVSYTDANGKTIATALAGSAPPNLDAIASSQAPEAQKHFKEELIKAGDFQRDASGLQLKASASFLAAVTGNFTINYTVNPAALTTYQASTGNFQFCSNCSYKILIEVRDECGDLKATSSTNAFQGNDVTCATNPLVFTNHFDFNANKEGEYTVNYILTLSEDVIKFHTDYYIANNVDLKQLQTFFQDELIQTDLRGCYNECSTCKVKLGTLADFTTKMQGLLQKLATEKYSAFINFQPNSPAIQNWISQTYTELYNNCAAISTNCLPPSPCDLKLEQLKNDVLPGGQYALVIYDEPSNTYSLAEPAINVLRFYNDPTIPEIYNLSFTNEIGEQVIIGSLSVSDFIKAYFKHSEWADQFVKKHIEYCSYLWCKDQSYANASFNNETSYRFDEKIREMSSGEEAQTQGLFNRNVLTAMLDQDPFFNGGRGTVMYKYMMTADLMALSDVIKATLKDANNNPLPVKNIQQYIEWSLYCKPTASNASGSDFVNSWSCFPDDACRSLAMEWQLFRGYYLQLKSKYLEIAKREAYPNCVNCFIGKDPVAGQGEINTVSGDPRPCPVSSDFHEELENEYSYSDYTWEYEQTHYEANVYLVHNGGPVSRDVKVLVHKTDQNCSGCSVTTTDQWITIPAGSDRAYIGFRYSDYYWDYYNYYSSYEDHQVSYDGNSITCPSTSNCITITTDASTQELQLQSHPNFANQSAACNHSDEFDCFRWTYNGYWMEGRSFMKFDMSAIPANATITSANISLYAHQTPHNGDLTHAQMGYNPSFLQRVTTTWPCGITWNSQPAMTQTHQAFLAPSSSYFQDYVGLDVTDLVRDLQTYGNNGIALVTANQNPNDYCSMLFYGPSASNPAKRPKLEVCFGPPTTIVIPGSTCTGDPNYDAYKDKNRIFNEYADVQGYLNYNAQNPPSTDPNVYIQKMRDLAIENLDALKQNWFDKLAAVAEEENALDVQNGVSTRFGSLVNIDVNGVHSYPTIQSLVDNLYQVSKKWIEIAPVDNIRPASTLPVAGDPDWSATQVASNSYNNFTEVFTAIIGTTLMNKGFGPHLLEEPAPYNKTYFTTDPNTVDLTNDIKNNITNIRNSFLATGGTTNAQFHSYLQQQLGNDYKLTQAQLDDILARMNNNCRLLNEPLILPVAFVTPKPANADHPFVTCTRVGALQTAFNQLYPNVTQGTKLYRVLLKAYMNQQLGYALTYEEYNAFLSQKCPLNPSASLFNQPASPNIQYDEFQCTADLIAGVFDRAGQEYERYIEIERRKFRDAYISKCLGNSAAATVEGDQYEYHYTLYYYDQSGSLVKTIPPEGVKLLTDEELALVREFRDENIICDGSGVPGFENKAVTYGNFSNELAGGTAKGMDLWTYVHDPRWARQIRFITTDQKYLYQAAINNQKLWVEMYEIDPGSSDLRILQSRKGYADLGTLPLQNWTHLFVQSSGPFLHEPNTAFIPNGNYSDGSLVTSAINDFTVELWVNPTSSHEIDAESASGFGGVSGQKYVLFPVFGGAASLNRAGMGISVGTNGVSVYEHADSYLPATLVWPGTISGWTHVAVVYQNRIPSLYVNGTWVKTGVQSAKASVLPGNMFPGGSYGQMTGSFDEVRVWNYARSQSQIAANMGTMLAGNTSGLAAYWPLSKEDGSSMAPDKTGNGWDRTLPSGYSGSSWTTSTPALINPLPQTGSLELYVDGKKLNAQTSGPAYPFAWQVNVSTGGYIKPAEDVAILKHLRVYDRPATDGEVYANYKNSCLSPTGALAGQSSPLMNWGRFNLPAPGSETTIGAGSTVEQVNRFIVPRHNLPTNYAYNSLNQATKQSSPDGGTSEFWYDRVGRLTVSQNAEQKQPAIVDAENPAGRYSYTRYDAIGRIVEVGEKLGAAQVSEDLVRSDLDLLPWLATGSNRQVTVTAYDNAPLWTPAGVGSRQFNLRKRVTATALLSSASPVADPSQNRVAASYYSYDPLGNVQELIQENTTQSVKENQYISGGNGLKSIKYEYDLVSGKVNKVLYQDGKWDQFYHQYVYDAENRLTDVYTSRYNYTSDAAFTNWVHEAHYRYYLHGPLARLDLGKNQVQGLDYAYTLQGWLKGVNSKQLDATKDMSGDGAASGNFSLVGRDVIGFSLGYHAGDYTPIGGSGANAFGLSYDYNSATTTGKALYNGNIGHATYAVSGLDNGATIGYTYRYDQLNRLTGMNSHGIANGATSWSNTNIVSDYHEEVSYDGNGNIKTYLRNGTTRSGQPGLSMDNLSYGYNVDADGRLVNNKLRHVKDAVGTNAYDDIENQADDNYSYDKIGNLIADGSGLITRINWTVYGKIAGISKSDGSTITYSYDATGNRTTKKFTNASNQTTTTYYVRDAQGNVMGTYSDKSAGYSWDEQHIYGSNRLGMIKPSYLIGSGQVLGDDSYNAGADPAGNGVMGLRAYDLSNHLGNVLATISDQKVPVDANGDGTVDYYNAMVLSAQDYYPFGMLMPGRKYGALGRYGFNGKENDNEVKGEGNQQDYGERSYDVRIGRWISVDPLASLEPGWSAYRYCFNNPNFFMDRTGEIETPLKATAIYDPVALLKVQKDFTVRVNKQYVKANKHFVRDISSIGHVAKWYGYAYVSNGLNKMTAEQKLASKNGMLAQINSGFFKSRTVGTSPHIGVDLRAVIGTNVYSFGDGRIIQTGYSDGTGNFAVIQYSNGDKVRFMHLKSISLNAGDAVSEGQVFAQSGNTGYMRKGVHYPQHLHVDGADRSGNMVNPLERNYGTVSNAEFFGSFDGDWRKLQDQKIYDGGTLPTIIITTTVKKRTK